MCEVLIPLEGDLSMNRIPGILATMDSLWDSHPSYVVLDLTDVSFIWPSVITLLTTCVMRLRRDGFPVEIKRPASVNVDTYLNRVDFYNLLKMNVDYPWRRHNAEGRFREVIQVQSERKGEAIAQEVLQILDNNLEGVRGIHQALEYALLEVVNNVFHHAQSPIGPIICAQSYPWLRVVEMAVVDAGRGIPASLSHNPELAGRFETASEAIDLAVKPRITGRPDHNTGEGLFFSLEFIKANGGEACVYSQDGALWIDKGHSVLEDTPKWPGTIVSLSFCTDHPVDTTSIFNRYAPPDNDYDWLFEE
jgi:hypothetical protein